jgi:hypothetical protein
MNIEQHIRRKRLANISLSNQAKSIILGSLLGNGYLRIYKGYKNATFSIRHTDSQKEYLTWKKAFLDSGGISGTMSKSKPDDSPEEIKWIFQSHVSTELTGIINVTHKQNKLKIRRTWLNHLTASSLAVWWCDAGSLTSLRRRGVFCTDGFDEKSCLILSQYLQKVWNVRASMKPIFRKKYNKYYYRLWLCSSELKTFLRIVIPHTPLIWDLFEKKIIICYKDRYLQQRWISEVFSLLKDRENNDTKEFFDRFRERYSPMLEKNGNQKLRE